MAITLRKNNRFMDEIREEMGKRLFAAAVFFATHHQQRVGVPNPFPHDHPSVPGEYPKKRTGFGQKSVLIRPDNPDEIKKNLVIYVGYAQAASYMPSLQFLRGRLGMSDTLEDLRPQIKALLGKNASASARS